MRGLAGLPFVLPLPGEGRERFQPIALDDLAAGLAKLAVSGAPSRTTLYAAGPETVSVRDILVAYRAWLGFSPAREIVVPLPLLRTLLRLGDVAGWLGHVSSARTTSLVQLRYDTLVDGAAFAQASGVAPKGFSETLRASPATLQDRLHARSFFAVPAAARHPCRILDPDRHPDAHAAKLRIRDRARGRAGFERRLRQGAGGRGLDRRHCSRRAVSRCRAG